MRWKDKGLLSSLLCGVLVLDTHRREDVGHGLPLGTARVNGVCKTK